MMSQPFKRSPTSCHLALRITIRAFGLTQHRESCRVKLARLNEQRADLAACLDALLADAAAGKAYFKIYRQFKMYNDPNLNPQLYASKA